MEINLLDCIAHGTTHEEFLASFNGDAAAAAAHLRSFYVSELENSTVEYDEPTDDDLNAAEKSARRYFQNL